MLWMKLSSSNYVLMIPFAYNKETFIFGLYNQAGIRTSIDSTIILIIKQ